MNFILPILLIQALLTYLGKGFVNGERNKNYDDILKSLKYPEKLIFDVTLQLNSSKLEEDRGVKNHEHVLDQLGVRLSPVVYFAQDESENNRPPWLQLPSLSDSSNLPKTFLSSSQHSHSPELYSLQSLPSKRHHDIVHNAKKDGNLTVVFSLLRPGIPIDFAHIGLREFLGKGVNLGVEYDSSLSGDDKIPPLISLVHVVIVNVAIPAKFPLSYSVFRRELTNKLRNTIELVRDGNPNSTIYAKLNFPMEENTGLDLEMIHKYYFYFLQFSVFWVNAGERGNLILPGFDKSLEFQTGFDGEDWRKVSQISLLSQDVASPVGDCGLKAMLNLVSEHFSSLTWNPLEVGFFKRNRPKCVLTNGPDCLVNKMESKVCSRPTISSALPDFTALQWIYPNIREFHRQIDRIKTALEDLPWKQIELYFHHQKISNRSLNELRVGLESIPAHVTIICGFRDYFDNGDSLTNRKYVETMEKVCGLMDQVTWNIEFNSKDVYVWSSGLIAFDRKLDEFSQRFPPKTVKPLVTVSPSCGRGSDLYCNPECARKMEIAEVAINFARLHNMSFRGEFGIFWAPAEPIPELSITNQVFPLFVSRSYPENFMLGEFPTDPCLSWTEVVPQNGIEMDADYAGTTLFMDGMKGNSNDSNRTGLPISVTSDELQTMLMFVLHKFSLIEIVPGSLSELNTVLDVLSRQELTDQYDSSHGDDDRKRVEIYLRMNFNHFSKYVYEFKNELDHVLERLRRVAVAPTGIHFVNWENTLSPESIASVKERASGNMIGLSLEDCVGEVNNGFRFRSLRKYDSFQAILHDVDYLLCNIKQTTEASNTDILQMRKYLDSTLYIRKYFQRLFPKESKNVSLFFRLNTKPSPKGSRSVRVTVHGKTKKVTRNQLSDFISFISDVSQYAGLYKMKLFMVPAFDDESGSRFGWWKVRNFSNLSDASSYIEKEAEYLRKETWRPTQDEQVVSQPFSSPLFISEVLIAILILLIIGVIFLIRQRYRRQYSFLSKGQVEQFRNGQVENELGQGQFEKSFDNLKFPKEYEISRLGLIELSNIIGKGTFGLVYTAKISVGSGERIQAAVKVPVSDCASRFRSMLSELKILCYVGSHPHVIQFLGAYIKEIGAGMVYIATAFCENGSLLDYLRRENPERESDHINEYENLPNELVRHQGGKSGLQFYELCRFSHEISLGMEFIASKKIVHGDLSARNVLMDANRQCKIGDFGLSRKLYEYQEYIKKNAEPLPWRWMAVESLKRMEFTTKSDVWSYGVTLWEIFSLGSIPYPGRSWTVGFVEELENGLRMPNPPHSSKEVYEIMLTCWDPDQEKRPSFVQLSNFCATLREQEYLQL